jgi:ABC-type amino acid transport substrate-binding protein
MKPMDKPITPLATSPDQPLAAGRRQTLRGLALLGAGALGWPLAARAETGNLEQIKARGVLTVAVYDNLPPYFVKGQGGIELRLAEAIAADLGVKASFLPFPGDDEMADDLRAMVWKGHYLGYGPADIMLHVPVDRPLMVANPQVRIFAPYCRERVMLARSRKALPQLDDLQALKGQAIAVSGDSLPGMLLLGAEGGVLQPGLRTTFPHGVAAAQALLRGEVQAAGGLQSELESVLAGNPDFEIGPLPVPRPPIDGWAVGCAVRKDATALGDAVQASINRLSDSGEMKALFATAKVSWRKP